MKKSDKRLLTVAWPSLLFSSMSMIVGTPKDYSMTLWALVFSLILLVTYVASLLDKNTP